MLYTLNQAARVSQKGKAAILNSIGKGRLSAKKNEKGEWEIDASELARVYPLTGLVEPTQNQYLPDKTVEFTTEISGLKARLEVMQELLSEVRGERDNLRHQVSSLTALLPAPQKLKEASEDVAADRLEPKQEERATEQNMSFWDRLFKKSA